MVQIDREERKTGGKRKKRMKRWRGDKGWRKRFKNLFLEYCGNNKQMRRNMGIFERILHHKLKKKIINRLFNK